MNRGLIIRRCLAIALSAMIAVVAAAAAPKNAKPAPVTIEDIEWAFTEYDFDKAEKLLSQYEQAKKRDKKLAEAEREIEAYRHKILAARNMMERVEMITIVDSFTVAQKDFFKAMRLAKATGSLSAAPAQNGSEETTLSPMFTSEDGTQLWVAYNSKEEAPDYACYRATKLADGSAAPIEKLFSHSTIFADGRPGRLATPFLMADGVTLYFAADGDASIGGLDIFLTREDGNGGFLQPTNIGMPFNSPANDYMMAIDEVTGFGWWATDRNAPEGMVTIFVYLPSEVRINYPADTEDLAALARLSSVARMREDNPTAQERLKILSDKRIMLGESASAPAFRIALPDGRVAESLNDFRNSTARLLMTRLISETRNFDAAQARLEQLRQRYAKGETKLKDQILSMETDLETQRQALQALRNEIVTNETGN
mgnify:FL=1